MLMTSTPEQAKNIAAFFSASEFRKIEERALEIAAEIEAKTGKFRAEIVENCTPQWRVLLYIPGMVTQFQADLQMRGFGFFDPIFDEKVIVRGRQRTKRSRLVPGYLLVFVWDIEAHKRRLEQCRGYAGILYNGGTNTPAVVDDKIIEYLQGKELSTSLNNTNPNWGPASDQPEPTRKQKRASRKNGSRGKDYQPTAVAEPERTGKIVFRCKSYLHGIEGLAPEDRISAFNKAIGLG